MWSIGDAITKPCVVKQVDPELWLKFLATGLRNYSCPDRYLKTFWWIISSIMIWDWVVRIFSCYFSAQQGPGKLSHIQIEIRNTRLYYHIAHVLSFAYQTKWGICRLYVLFMSYFHLIFVIRFLSPCATFLDRKRLKWSAKCRQEASNSNLNSYRQVQVLSLSMASLNISWSIFASYSDACRLAVCTLIVAQLSEWCACSQYRCSLFFSLSIF